MSYLLTYLLSSPKKSPWICMNPVAMPVDGKGARAAAHVLPMDTLL